MKSWYVADTHKYGRGVFAKRNIKKGEAITILKGKVFTGMKYERGFHRGDGKTWIQIDKLRWLKSKIGSYLNHSCNPDAGILGRKLVALRNIKKNEEIVYDYDIRDWNEWGYHLDCRCGSKNCRKVIKGYKHLPKSVQRKYQKLGLIPDFLIRLDNGERLES